MSRSFRLSLALLVSAALAASPLAQPAQARPDAARSASAAHAPVSRVTLVDGTADVWLIGPGEDTWHFFGSRPAVDFTRAVGAHRADEVRATMRFLNLRRVRPQDFTVRIRSSEGFRRAIVSTGPGSWGGTNRLLDLRERVRDCPGLRHDIDYGRDRVVVRIPRECLGNPTWVRLAISAYLFRPRNELSDNPHNARAVPTFTRRLQPMPG